MYKEPFRFSNSEAKIVARWEIGVRNCITPITVLIIGFIIGVEVLRFILKMPVAPIGFYIADVVAIFCFTLALQYINKRIFMTAKEIIKREFSVDFDFNINGVLVSEYGIGVVYKTLFCDIISIYAGNNILRINSKYGAICLPCSQIPEEFIVLMRQQLSKKNYRVLKWM